MKTLEELSMQSTIGRTKQYKEGFPFYEIMKDGIYQGMSNGCMVARKKVVSYAEEEVFSLAAKGKEGFELTIPKIPFKYWEMIWSFYNTVNSVWGTEATVLLYWNNRDIDLTQIPQELKDEYGKGLLIDGKLILYVPKQQNSGALTAYHGDQMRVWLGNNTANLLDTHSHNSMSAFFSGTDDANEKRFQFYSVFGEIGTNNTCILRYRFQDKWYNIDLFDLFEEGSIDAGYKGKYFPEEWIDQCTFNSYSLQDLVESTKVFNFEDQSHVELKTLAELTKEERIGVGDGKRG